MARGDRRPGRAWPRRAGVQGDPGRRLDQASPSRRSGWPGGSRLAAAAGWPPSVGWPAWLAGSAASSAASARRVASPSPAARAGSAAPTGRGTSAWAASAGSAASVCAALSAARAASASPAVSAGRAARAGVGPLRLAGPRPPGPRRLAGPRPAGPRRRTCPRPPGPRRLAARRHRGWLHQSTLRCQRTRPGQPVRPGRLDRRCRAGEGRSSDGLGQLAALCQPIGPGWMSRLRPTVRYWSGRLAGLAGLAGGWPVSAGPGLRRRHLPAGGRYDRNGLVRGDVARAGRPGIRTSPWRGNAAAHRTGRPPGERPPGPLHPGPRPPGQHSLGCWHRPARGVAVPQATAPDRSGNIETTSAL